MWFDRPGGGKEFGIGVGTLVLAVNIVLLGGYTLVVIRSGILGGFLSMSLEIAAMPPELALRELP
jgi:hypothetical protein